LLKAGVNRPAFFARSGGVFVRPHSVGKSLKAVKIPGFGTGFCRKISSPAASAKKNSKIVFFH
jgi:hypothetical protein